MQGINKAIIVGNLGQKPEVKYSTSGRALASFSVATNDSWTDKNSGQRQERTEWHRVVIFGKLAEVAGQYLSKGSKVYVEGKLRTRKWQDKNGVDRWTTEIVISGYGDTFEMLDQKGGENPQHQQQNPQNPPAEKTNEPPAAAKKSPKSTANETNTDDFDDDIPF